MKDVFFSNISDKIEAFIAYKRSCGLKYDSCHDLIALDRYAITHGNPSSLTKELCIGFIADRDKTNSFHYRQYIVTIRSVGKFLQMRGDTDAYLLDESYQMHRYHPEAYIFTDFEMESFFNCVDNSAASHHRNKGRPIVIPAYFRFLYSTGCRTFEARRLLKKDVHLDLGYVDIINSKGYRDRRLYLTADVIELLKTYDTELGKIFFHRELFFPSTYDTVISASEFRYSFNEIWDDAGLRKAYGKQPTPYSFRHHFAFTNIRRWTEQGIDVNAMLPYLMRYMGHSSLESTLYYVHNTPDFLDAYSSMTKRLDSLLPEVVPYEE